MPFLFGWHVLVFQGGILKSKKMELIDKPQSLPVKSCCKIFTDYIFPLKNLLH